MATHATIAYGKSGIPVSVPDTYSTYMMEMQVKSALPNLEQRVQEALARPIGCPALSQLARGRKNAVIVISDITRPVPNQLILPPILKVLHEAGLAADQISILIATGIHRPNEGAELEYLVGAEIARTYRCINHRSREMETMYFLGQLGDAVPVYLDKHYLDADLKILTGLIEPHLLAGYSGGRKAVLPGLAALETMQRLHGYKVVADHRTVAGELDNNPFHQLSLQVARMAGADFILYVTLNASRQVTGVYAGELDLAHRQGVADLEKCVIATVPAPVDIAVTGSAGFPLDQTFYQSIKGMVAAHRIVRPGGTIVFCAHLGEGEGSPEFRELIEETRQPDDFLIRAAEHDFIKVDQWMFQELCEVVKHYRVLCYTESFPPERVRRWMVEPVPSLQAGLDLALEAYGPSASVALIPQGPYVISRIAA